MAVYEPCSIYPKSTPLKPDGLQEQYKNNSSIYSNTGSVRSYFIVSPQWLSEKLEAPPTTARSHRPWPFEFPGARYATAAITEEEDQDQEEEERSLNDSNSRPASSVRLLNSMPVWGSLSVCPRSWASPARYSYQLDSSRFDPEGTRIQPSRCLLDDVWMNPTETRDKQPAPIINPFPQYKYGPRPPTPPRFGRVVSFVL